MIAPSGEQITFALGDQAVIVEVGGGLAHIRRADGNLLTGMVLMK